jgi:putative tricarboxylic transport membrane protein
MNRRDLIGIAPYAAILVMNVFLYYQALQIAPVGDGRLGADLWPKTILILAIATCLWEIARKIGVGVARNHRIRKNGLDDTSLIPRAKPTNDAPEVGHFVPWIGIALTATYVFAFPWLGYFLATFLYVTAFVYLGNYRRVLVAAGIGLVASLAFMFLFMRVVYVSLPIGVGPFGQISALLMRAMRIK